MPVTKSDRDIAGARYAAAVTELRAAYGDLAAIDRLLNLGGFGTPPEIVPLRHAQFAPDLSGSFSDDINAAFAARSAS